MMSLLTRVWLLTSTSLFISTSAQFEAGDPAHGIRHNQTLCEWLVGTTMILNFRQAHIQRETVVLAP